MAYQSSGYFTKDITAQNKVAEAAKTNITIAAANLAKMGFISGSGDVSDHLWVRAFDGLALVPAVFVSSDRYDPIHPETSAGVVLKPFLMSELAGALDFALPPRRVSGDGAVDAVTS